ncbi:iron-siderophore ABC transporter substrate-binding protein [Paenibacillus rhizovicinus]|uniref:Iron-siderophore ABC transporter substrate-binding protein n=1 Tax=Paenibacillus rhizovicinus TaxID=2704463 RepID=A0A6C0P519_9BACL|nr:iron-siderophore ABC transporter substrate-binding protein [Paenibacillus rhizovicinus]QHW33628.1 iron-siderophore ABC transporter substrate-binding protein [Paenibacillus rhizovicinus]
MIASLKLPKWVGSVSVVTAVVIGLMGCSSNNNNGGNNKEAAGNTNAATNATDTANAGNTANTATTSFNATIDTKFGQVKITEEPKRVVALGWGDAETALALGVQPVGASDWLAFGGEGVGPWLQGAYTTAPTILGTMELDYEKIASLHPDLILDTKSSGDEERYKKLSEIATTVGVPADGASYMTTTNEQVDMIAKALGKETEGAALLKKVDDAFAKAAADHPEFAGKNIVVGAYSSDGFGAYVKGDARVDFMERLGFKNKEAVEKLANGNFFIKVSDEQLDLLDSDVTVVLPIWVDSKEITDNKLYQKIPSVVDGRSIILDKDTSNAFSTGTIPSLLWTIEHLPAQIQALVK